MSAITRAAVPTAAPLSTSHWHATALADDAATLECGAGDTPANASNSKVSSLHFDIGTPRFALASEGEENALRPEAGELMLMEFFRVW